MGLIVNNAKFQNTEINAPQIYLRLQWIAQANGFSTSVVFLSGLDKQGSINYQQIDTNIPKNMQIQLEAGQSQDLLTIHEVCQTKLQELGFVVTIDLT